MCVCVLAPALFNLFSDAVIMLLDGHQVQNKGVGIAYLHNAKLLGNRRESYIQLETLVTDLENADEMALLADSWNDLEAMLTTLSTHCSAFGLSISCSKTKTMAILPPSLCAQPVPMLINSSSLPCFWNVAIVFLITSSGCLIHGFIRSVAGMAWCSGMW